MPRSLFLSLLILALGASAQEYTYTRLDVKEGLAGSNVYAATQDHEGFMWFATETGLSRFDGRRFTTFTTADGLPDNEIINIYTDSKGRIWIIPFRKSICYFYKGKLHTTENDPLLKQFRFQSNILLIEEDSRGNLIFLELTRIHLLNNLNQLSSYDNIEGCSKFTAVSRSPKGFYLSINDRLYEWTNGSFINKGSGMASAPALNTVIIDGTVIVRQPYPFTGQTRIAKRDGGTAPFEHYREHISFSVLDDSLFTDNGHNGVYLHNIRKRGNALHLLPGKSVSRVFRDRDGNTWFCTQREGVYLLHPEQVKNVMLRDGLDQKLSVHALTSYKGLLAAGTSMGYLICLRSGRTVTARHQVGDAEEDAKVRVLAISDGQLVYGTQSSVGLFGRGNPKEVPALKDIMVLDSQWLITSYQGVFLANKNDLDRVDTIWRERATTAFYRKDSFYIGTLEGLNIVIRDRKIVRGGDIAPALQSRIASIREAADGSLWIATYDKGILVYRDGKVMANITAATGLTSDICRALFIYKDFVWVGTDKGLNRIMAAPPYTVRKYTLTDGFSSNFINAVYVDDSSVYAGTSDGISYFNLRDNGRNVSCRLQVTSVFNGKQVRLDQKSVFIADRHHPLVFEYAGISFDCGNELTYRYRLSGLDSNWTNTTMTSLNYAALKPGDYRLELQAVNYYGNASEIIMIPFSVRQWWWEKTAIQVPVLLMLAALVAFTTRFVIRYMQKKEREKAEIREKLAELEQKALKSQMNPHFIFNSLNSIQNYVVSSDITGGNRYISAFAKLIRLTLENSDRTEIPVSEEAKYLAQYLGLEKIRMNERFDYSISVDEELRSPQYRIPPMLLQPLVENSLRHGIRYITGKGMIVVSMRKEAAGLKYVVEDNGAGFNNVPGKNVVEVIEYHSRGLQLLRQRIEAMNSQRKKKIELKIEDLSEQGGQGTRISIFYPFN